MTKYYMFFANWRKKDVDFLKQFKLDREPEIGYFGFGLPEGDIFNKISNHYSQVDSLWFKTQPPEFSITFANVFFSLEEIELAKTYTSFLGDGKLEYFWRDSTIWKSDLYGSVCPKCEHSIGPQEKPWILKRDFKQLEKHPFVSFEGLGGYVFCSKIVADLIQKEFGIEQMDVLIGQEKKVSEHLVQLQLPLATHRLNLDGNGFGKPYEGNDSISCSTCSQSTLTTQTLDFFPPFEKKFEFDIVLSQEWFGWYRRIVVSKRFLDFCYKHKFINKKSGRGLIIPQIQN